MTPTSPELEQLLRHYSGHEQIGSAFRRRNWDGGAGVLYEVAPEMRLLGSLKQSFGKKEFDAAICFIDMVGFSERVKGRPPKEVCGIVRPFLRTVIATATTNKCFVDKTIGDEVMVVMPAFPDVSDPLTDVAWFLFDLVEEMEATIPEVQFCAGIAFGEVFLDSIETDSYQEWSVFGNCVNGAKRLQEVALPKLDGNVRPSRYRAIMGAVDSEHPNFLERLEEWLQLHLVHPTELALPLEFINARKDCEALQGVGRMCFQDAFIRRRKGIIAKR